MATKKITVSGKVTNRDQQLLSNLRIEAWDKDLLIDDFLAETLSDANGQFTLVIETGRFEELFLDKRPDVYFKIFHGEQLIKTTYDTAFYNLENDLTGIEIIVEFSVTPEIPVDLPDVVTTFNVSGTVHRNGKVASGILVQAFDQDLPSKKIPRTPLGKPVFTDPEGRFSIPYTADQFKRAENETADVVLTLSDRKGVLLHTTAIHFNAPQDLRLEIEFSVNDESTEQTELERYLSRMKPLLEEELTVDQLTQADVDFIAKEAEIPVEQLQLLQSGYLLRKETGISEVFFYGLFRQAITTNLSGWALYKPDELKEAYLKSVEKKIVPALQDLDKWIEQVLKIALEMALNRELKQGNEQSISVGALLGTVIQDTDKQLKFLELYHGFEGDRTAFWSDLQQHPDFQQQADELAFTLQLSKLSYQNLSFVEAVRADQRFKKAQDLVVLDTNGWETIIRENQIPIPTHITGQSTEQKTANYAQSITAVLETSFPNAYVAKMAKEGGAVHTEVIEFLENSEHGFAINQTPIDRYLSTEEGNEVLERFNDKDVAVAQLKQLQRLYSITGDSQLTMTFLQSNIQSAHQIASMPLEEYLYTMEDSGVETQILLSTHARATHITETNVIVVRELEDYYRTALPQIMRPNLEGVEEVIRDIPSYEKLFGSLDSCDCGHCRSVYSATAYFVELMHEFLGGKTNANPFRELMERRPDLKFIRLTCENTETEIPYIDLVNEILETYIGFNQLDEAHVRDTSNFTAQELGANPQFIVNEAHTQLRSAVYPLNMPFDLHLETAREYLQYLGSSRYEVMKHVAEKVADPAKETARLAESLRLSVKEYELLTTQTFAGTPVPPAELVSPHALYGYANNVGPLGHVDRIKRVSTFLERTAITYDELIALLQTTFLNPKWHIVDYLQDPTIADDPIQNAEREAFKTANQALITGLDTTTIVLRATLEASCDLNQTFIVYKNNSDLSNDAFAKINRFIRLWKKLGLTIEETDLMLCAFNATNDITPLAIKQIAHALLANHELKLPIEKLASLWSLMPMIGKKSVYQRLFLNKAALKIDDMYLLNLLQAELKTTTAKIKDHIPALLAAFKVKEEDIEAIRRYESLNTDNAPLNVATISTLHRYTVLAKAVKLSVQELITVLQLSPSKRPFDATRTADIPELLQLIRLIETSGFSLEKLRFLYQPHSGDDSVFVTDSETILQLAKTIGEGLEKQEGDAKKDFVRLNWSTALRLDEKVVRLLMARFPDFENHALALRSTNTNPILTTFTETYHRLSKIALFINGFKLKIEELTYLLDHPLEFDNFNLMDIPVSLPVAYSETGFIHWQRLAAYAGLKKQLRIKDESLIKVFNASSVDFAAVSTTLRTATGWSEAIVKDLIGTAFGEGLFESVAADFRNEKILLRLATVYRLGEKVGLSTTKLKNWAQQPADSNQSMDIKNTVRAKYEDAEWYAIAQEISNTLREKNRDALVSYLLAQPAVRALGIHDSNDLYGYFLIDVEMQSCMMTSRIVQANASIQLFIQRCLMNLEKDVNPTQIDKKRWKWMKKYRVWEANRKVFLYPENWIEPELRDDKSPFFKELENTLLQGEVNNENVEKALGKYLHQLDTVANLNVRAMYEDQSRNEIHVVARTKNIPYQYFYRKFNTKTAVWSAWKKVEADIEGDYLNMIVWNGRLMLFWLNITEKAGTQSNTDRISGRIPANYYENRLCWSEFKQGAWQPKSTSKEHLIGDVRLIYPEIKNGGLTINCGSGYYSENQFFGYVGYRVGDSHDHGIALTVEKAFRFDTYNSGCTVDIIPSSEQWRVTNTHDSYEELTNYDGLALIRKNDVKPVLNSDSYMDGITTPTHIPKFKPGNYFFVSGENQSYFVQTNMVELPIIFIPMQPVSPLLPEIPEFEEYTPYQPWKDDPYPGWEIFPEMGWDTPVLNGTPMAEMLQLNVQYGTQNFNGMAAPMMLKAANIEKGNSEKVIPMASSYTYGNAAAKERFGFQLGVYPMLKGLNFQFHGFYHKYVDEFIKNFNTKGVDGLLTIANQKLGERSFNYTPTADNSTRFKQNWGPQSNVSTPYPHELIDFSENGAYSQYNWELFFHVPMLIANRLSKNQRFEEAMNWYHYVFNPTSDVAESSPMRFWNLLPFKLTPGQSIEQLLAKLQLPDGNPEKTALKNQIEQWRDNPFNPHLIARMRLMAYMKNVVMKYLDNLMAWGDYLFRMETRESVNEAIQIYILAAEILGKKPQKISRRGKVKSENYETLRPRLDAFQNAVVDMETFFPNYSETPVSNSADSDVPQLTSILKVFYFCIPDNDKLLGYWEKVADRLFKIRHCQNIDGLALKLSLFEPPIDPALLVQATAQGLDIGSVIADINGATVSLYRFNYLHQKALEFTNELKGISGSLLTAIEKKDAEEFSALRSSHETSLLHLMRETKKLQYQESVVNRENILKTRENTVSRWQHYKKLLGDANPIAPAIGEMVRGINSPEDGERGVIGGRQLSSYEGQDLGKSAEAAIYQEGAGMYDTLSSIMHIIPNWNVEPWGVGATFGGSNLGSFYSAFANGFRTAASSSLSDATRASKLGGFFRREQDWALQCNTAAKEIMAIDKQLLAAEIRIDLAAKERDNLEIQIENAQEIESFLKTKYSNEDLYGWMQGEISTIYFQAYQLAYDLAKKAELAYRYELGIGTSNFIQYGYWDSFKKGLLAGDKLSLALRQLEKAWIDGNKREFELTKHISLASLDPLALIKLRATGSCDFTIPEVLFDIDHPGHFFRRIKSVSISLPCVAGPYTSVSAMLSLGKNKYRKEVLPASPYAESATPDSDVRFAYNLTTTQSIATSSGQNDTGLFELNFRDERYLPFEGTGAISNWTLELPTEVRQFDYNTIADVVVHMKYTSRANGTLKTEANGVVRAQLNELKQAIDTDNGSHLAFNMRQEFPNEWHLLKNGSSASLTIAANRFPFLVQSAGFTIDNVWLIAKVANEPDHFTVHVGVTPVVLDKKWELYAKSHSGISVGTPFTLTIPDTENVADLEELLLVVNYKLA
ncbi:MAG: neuraminidase-like domain-containing protein [Fluviicola sp.]|nr:neuraminidase-like domain-containing protein [Fluviicola sp.]